MRLIESDRTEQVNFKCDGFQLLLKDQDLASIKNKHEWTTLMKVCYFQPRLLQYKWVQQLVLGEERKRNADGDFALLLLFKSPRVRQIDLRHETYKLLAKQQMHMLNADRCSTLMYLCANMPDLVDSVLINTPEFIDIIGSLNWPGNNSLYYLRYNGNHISKECYTKLLNAETQYSQRFRTFEQYTQEFMILDTKQKLNYIANLDEWRASCIHSGFFHTQATFLQVLLLQQPDFMLCDSEDWVKMIFSKLISIQDADSKCCLFYLLKSDKLSAEHFGCAMFLEYLQPQRNQKGGFGSTALMKLCRYNPQLLGKEWPRSLLIEQHGKINKWNCCALGNIFRSDNVQHVDFDSDVFRELFELEKDLISRKGLTMLMQLCECAPELLEQERWFIDMLLAQAKNIMTTGESALVLYF